MSNTELIARSKKVAAELDDFNSSLDRKAAKCIRELLEALQLAQAAPWVTVDPGPVVNMGTPTEKLFVQEQQPAKYTDIVSDGGMDPRNAGLPWTTATQVLEARAEAEKRLNAQLREAMDGQVRKVFGDKFVNALGELLQEKKV